MKTISLHAQTAPPTAIHAMCHAVEQIGDTGFVPALLAVCREAAGASDCSFFVHRGGTPIGMGTARLPGLQAHDVGECYVRDGYYRIDPVAAVALRSQDRLLLNCLTRDELPDGQWVHDYRKIGLQERISVMVALDGGWGILNAYRPADCGVELDDAIVQLGQQSPVIASAMRRHVALAAPVASPDPFAVLSQREQQVVDAILAGRSAKESARALGLSPTSIATYRRRAFEKLGIHRQIELAHLRKH